MARLDEAVKRAERFGDAVLVFAPGEDAGALSERLRVVAPERQVVELNCIGDEGAARALRTKASEGLGSDRLLHVAVGNELLPELKAALIELTADHCLPGTFDPIAPGSVVVVSTQARMPAQLGMKRLDAYFPLRVGPGEWEEA